MRLEDWLALHSEDLRLLRGKWVAFDLNYGIVASHREFLGVLRLCRERRPDIVPVVGRVGYDGVFEKFSKDG